MSGVEKVEEFMAKAKAPALRARVQIEKDLAAITLGGRNQSGLEIGQWQLANIHYVERKRDLPHRNSAYSFAELFVNCFRVIVVVNSADIAIEAAPARIAGRKKSCEQR
jgi:hypothetical protein